MQVISKEDLFLILLHVNNYTEFSLYDFDRLLVQYGDSYFVVDGEYQKTRSNERMAEIRKEYGNDELR